MEKIIGTIYQHDPYLFFLLTIVIFLYIYPYLYQKIPYFSEIHILKKFYKKISLTSIFKKETLRLDSLFEFKTDLLYDLLDPDPQNDFNDIYVPPKVRVNDATKKEITFKALLHIIETKITHRQIVYIEGKAGYGKTNLLKYIGWLTHQNKTAFKNAFYIRAKDIEEQLLKLEMLSYKEKFLLSSDASFNIISKLCYAKNGIKISESQIEKICDEKCILLVDGCDELQSPSNLTLLISTLRKFRSEKETLTIVLNGRPGSMDLNKDDQIHPDHLFQILPLSKENLKKLIKNTFKRIKKENNVNDLYMRIVTNTALFEIAMVPLLLTLIIRLYMNGTEIPEHKNLLLEKFLEMALNRKSGTHSQPLKKAIEATLIKVSFNLATNRDAMENIESIWSKEAKLIEKNSISTPLQAITYARSSGILNQESNRIEFSHKSIQDYLFSRYLFDLYRNKNDKNQISAYLVKSSNTDVIFFFCCLLKDSSWIFSDFLKNKRLDLCTDLVIWIELGSRIHINNTIIDEYWTVLKDTEDSDLIIKTKINLTLTKLKRGDNVSKKPVSVDDYHLIAGTLQKRHYCNGIVVGPDQEIIENFFDQLNKKFPDEKGKYVPVSAHYRINREIDSDAIIKEFQNFILARPDDKIFLEIKDSLSEEVNKVISSTLQNITTIIPVDDTLNFIHTLTADIIAGFHPNILLLREKDIPSNETSSYRYLKDLLHNHNTYRIYDRLRSGISLYDVIIGGNNEKKSQEAYDHYYVINERDGKKTTETLQFLLDASIYRMYISLILEGSETAYITAKKILLRSLILLMAESKKINLWGKIYIQYEVTDLHD